MRLRIAAANWKMNTNINEGLNLLNDVLENTGEITAGNQLILAVPFTHLLSVAQKVVGIKNVHVAAQNCFHENKGAYTGEVSASMIKSVGASHVIVGHSERRQFFAENEDDILKKILVCLYEKLKVIYCCGEPLEIREAGKHLSYVSEQLQGSILKLSSEQIENIIIAYEPVWAIGTGKTATKEQAQEMHAFIRKAITAKYGAEISAGISILYGGSVKANNSKELFQMPDIDGGLVGGASLSPEEFAAIVHAL
jgi:triosephosphate isomerase (TIM)